MNDSRCEIRAATVYSPPAATGRRWAVLCSLLLLALLLVSCRSTRAGTGTRSGRPDEGTAGAPGATTVAVTEGVRKTVLPNGLRVLTLERHSVPIVSCVMAYRVGSLDEPPGKSGMAHFLEHVMFKGTHRFGKGEIDLTTMKNGGSNNAWTNEDLTVYHFTFASDRWEIALEIEADRMRNCLFEEREIDAEKQVVIEELKSTLDSPWQYLSIEVGKEIFRGHPYARPVIGLESEIQAVTAKDLRAFYDRYYVPNNAVLVLVGDFQSEEVIRKVGERFAGIPAGADPSRAATSAQAGSAAGRRVEVTHGTTVDRLQIGFKTVKLGAPEDPVLDVIASLLGEGRSSRLHHRLVEDLRLASSVECSHNANHEAGAFTVSVECVPWADRARVEAVVAEEVAALAREKVPAGELRRAKNKITAAFTFGRATALGFGEELAYSEALRSYRDLDTYPGRIEAASAADLQRVAEEFLIPARCTVGWSLADRETPESSPPPPPPPVPATGASPAAPAPMEPHSAPRFDLRETWQVRLENGLQVLIYRMADLPVVSLQAHVEAGSLTIPPGKAGLAEMTGLMLLEGTTTRDSRRIAEEVENLGGILTSGEEGVALKLLSRDLDFGLGLVADLLRNPAFPDERLERQRQLALARLATEEDEPDTVARKRFLEAVYGEHPLGQPASGTVEAMKRLSRQDVVSHHGRYYRPNNTILAVVGDVEPADVLTRVRARFGTWAALPVRFPALVEPALASSPVDRYLPMPLEQVTVILGHLGVRRTDRDYVALEVMDHILGKGTGFTDRISRSLRDDQGLAYQVFAEITGSAGREPGVFRAYLATRPQNLIAAVEGLEAEIRKFLANPPTAEEVRNAQQYLVGSFVFQVETTDQIAAYLVEVTRHGLGLDYLSRYPGMVASVSPEEVHRVARVHLHPDRRILVVVGPVLEDGTPILDDSDDGGEAGADPEPRRAAVGRANAGASAR